MLAGLLSSALLVAVFTGLISVFPYLFKYTRGYTPVTIPDFTIYTYDELLAVTKEYDTFNFVVEFTDNVYAEGGEIISQSPRADTKRRMYDNERLTVTVTVCSYDESFTMKDYIGGSARDAELELRNLGFKVKVVNKYSGSIPAGSVIATSPQIDEVMTEGGYVTLTVSRGKRISYSLLPNLVGLSEASAVKKLKNLGFTIGEIKYSASESAAGTVIAQSKKRGSSLAQGTTISLTVSTGSEHTARNVPDLLGLTLEEAKNALREAGLALGKVYYINEENSDAEGLTVVKQTPPAKTEISSSVVSVDIHLG
jgi:serine/threonine-protein kinase